MKNKKYLALLSCAAVSLFLSANTYATDTSLYNTIKSQVNSSTDVDFTKMSTPSTGNGNGVNKYTEKNKDIYYYRGEVANNNVIWANKCWKIVRTTYTKGVKLLYNGNVDSNNQCPSENRVNAIASQSYNPASPYELYKIGYMRSNSNDFNLYSTSISSTQPVAISKNATWDATSQKYILDTSSGNYVVGTYPNIPEEALNTMFYFCMNGESSCEEVVYSMTPLGERLNGSVILRNGKTLDDFKAEIVNNGVNSDVKTITDSWSNYYLKNNENDLEDAIYCNDREIISGPLSSTVVAAETRFAAYERNFVVKNNNYHPSLECRKQDSFTKNDTTNGNGQLSFMVGLLTADEVTLAGASNTEISDTYNSYITSRDENGMTGSWTMTPIHYYIGYREAYSGIAGWTNGKNLTAVRSSYGFGIRPVVSLKAGAAFGQGDGTETNPYIVSSFIDEQDDEDDDGGDGGDSEKGDSEKDGSKKDSNANKSKIPKNPNTGDENKTMLYVAGASIVGIIALTKFLLKRR